MVIEQLNDDKAFTAFMETEHHTIIQIQKKIAIVNVPVVFEHHKVTTNLETEWILYVAKVDV